MNKYSFKSLVSLLLIFGGAAIVVFGFLPARTTSPYDLAGFGRLPVQYGTRVLPIDSVARNTLRLISTRTVLHIPKNGDPADTVDLPALQWYLDLALRPEAAARVPIFRIDHDELLGLIGQKQQGSQLFTFMDLEPHFDDIQKAADAADKKKQDEEPLSTFDTAVQRLRENLVIFQQMAVSFVPQGDEPAKDWAAWQDLLKPGAAAVLAHDAGKPYDQNTLDSFSLAAKQFMSLDTGAIVGLIPPANGADGKWLNLGHGALEALRTNTISPVLIHYGDLGEALQKDDPAAFNTAIAALQKDLAVPQVTSKVSFEAFMNNLEPFYRGILLYLMAFLCVCISWVAWGPELRRAALWLIIFGFGLLTFGLGARVYLTGFSVVTSLYSSALFVGWVAVLTGLLIEKLTKSGIGAAAASLLGFATLVIAQNLPFSGDNLELPQAVLATNLWLSTHVTCITTGYAAMFFAGALGAGYILFNAFSTKMDRARNRQLAQLVYGVTCFATLFSFVGTMLGGIWADQSWGRFWGWDPKENGALLIVLWCAICLHTRWGKLCSERTQMALAVGGNIVTAWSWFGVNLLGVGLHSYGFMQGTFISLIVFWVSQLAIISLAFMPGLFAKNAATLDAKQTVRVPG